MQTTEETIPGTKEEIKNLQVSIKDLQNSEVILVERIRQLRNELEHNRQSAEQFKNSSRLLQALMEQKRLGKISGVFGRLVSKNYLVFLIF